MTQNLDLDLSHDRSLTSEDTDLHDSSLSGAYSENYEYDPTNRIITWTPKNTTRDYLNSTGTAWALDPNVAYSLNSGNWYWNGNDQTPDCDYTTNTCEDFSPTPYSTIGTHGHVGNYYNWSATIASDDSSSLITKTLYNTKDNPRNSICPKNWRLPTISSAGWTTPNTTNEFARLNYLYNNNKTDTDIGLIEPPLYFIRSGSGYYGLASSTGYYQSSTVGGNSIAYNFSIAITDVKIAVNESRATGRSIRCIAE